MLLIRVLDQCWQYNSEQTTKRIPITFPENFLSNAVFTFQITYYSNCNQLQRTELFSLNLLERIPRLYQYILICLKRRWLVANFGLYSLYAGFYSRVKSNAEIQTNINETSKYERILSLHR